MCHFLAEIKVSILKIHRCPSAYQKNYLFLQMDRMEDILNWDTSYQSFGHLMLPSGENSRQEVAFRFLESHRAPISHTCQKKAANQLHLARHLYSSTSTRTHGLPSYSRNSTEQQNNLLESYALRAEDSRRMSWSPKRAHHTPPALSPRIPCPQILYYYLLFLACLKYCAILIYWYLVGYCLQFRVFLSTFNFF